MEHYLHTRNQRGLGVCPDATGSQRGTEEFWSLLGHTQRFLKCCCGLILLTYLFLIILFLFGAFVLWLLSTVIPQLL